MTLEKEKKSSKNLLLVVVFLDLLKDKENGTTDFAVFIHVAFSDQDHVSVSFFETWPSVE